MEKLIRDGQVAVIISLGYGAGWSTWSTENSEAMAFCPQLAEAILEGKDRRAFAEELFPLEYKGGLAKAVVRWVPEGQRFRIEEYDGAESLVLEPDLVWMTA